MEATWDVHSPVDLDGGAAAGTLQGLQQIAIALVRPVNCGAVCATDLHLLLRSA